jgi:hypothetical protein
VVEVVRESISRRGTRAYAIYWFRCPQCQEVSLRYRRLQDLPDDPPAGVESPLVETSEHRTFALPRPDGGS